MGAVAENFRTVLEKVEAAAKRAGREPGSVRLVTVSKTVPVERIREAVEAGARILGENRVQEALTKMETVDFSGLPAPEWHLIGTLQKNKARHAVGVFSLIHSIDSIELAKDVGRQAEKRGIRQKVLVEVNIAGEATKHGMRPEDALAAAKEISLIPGIELQGLMCVPPFTDDPEDSRPHFVRLRELLADINKAGIPASELSMGMSHDYEVAIEEGATLVRVGTAIFGKRIL